MRASRTQQNLMIDEGGIRQWLRRHLVMAAGLALVALAAALAAALATWSIGDPSLNHVTDTDVRNALGKPGAIVADILIQMIGLAAAVVLLPVVLWGWQLMSGHVMRIGRKPLAAWLLGTFLLSGALAVIPIPDTWPLPTGLGGVAGDMALRIPAAILGTGSTFAIALIGAGFGIPAIAAFVYAAGWWRREAPAAADDDIGRTYYDDEEDEEDEDDRGFAPAVGALAHWVLQARATLRRAGAGRRGSIVSAMRERLAGDDEDPLDDRARVEPVLEGTPAADDWEEDWDDADVADPDAHTDTPVQRAVAVSKPTGSLKPGKRVMREAQPSLLRNEAFEFPPIHLLAEAKKQSGNRSGLSTQALEQNARLLEGVLDDFGVRGEIIAVHPGPVVTLYELEPAPGIKSSRVIGLADDIARSMSAISARVAVIPGKNAIGIELPNQRRETVFLRELIASEDFEKSKAKLSLCLGKTIGGDPVIADLARMPHLLVAGTTGSGKSVSINTMILSLLYRLPPDKCKLIMIDPKMLELSVYDGIPHLLSPVVTDPKKAVVALKWTVREMEERYQKMSKLGVRNIDGFNTRVAQAEKKGETITRTVQTGFDPDTGEAIYEEEDLDLAPMPYIVVIVDEMADLMMVAGKDIEGAIQRLAQMARAAGIHIIMATQRPSVDVITGTIKANFPTRISFQVTSKIDSRTILGEQGAEQLLGQGDMLYMAGGGRIQRVHGPFVADDEVEEIVAHLKDQGAPEYLDQITNEEDADGSPYDLLASGSDDSNDLYDQAVAVVLRDRKASTSYVQRRLSIGYNRAASIIERMEQEGLIGPANHAGKREILVGEGAEDY
ncbi:FtsK/SpoIIIE family DNA translocase [Rhodobium gokarnense]